MYGAPGALSKESLQRAVQRVKTLAFDNHDTRYHVKRWASSRRKRQIDPHEILPAREIQTRLELIETIGIRLFPPHAEPGYVFFRVLMLAYLMVVPVAHLKRISQMCDLVPPYDILDNYLTYGDSYHDELWNEWPPEFTLVVPKRLSRRGPLSITSLRRLDGIPERAVSHVEQLHEDLSRERGTCILTGRPFPDVCYIVPCLVTVTGDTVGQRFSQRTRINVPPEMATLTGNHVYCVETSDHSDKSWNLLCLDPILHHWWSQSLFGLKCVRIFSIQTEDLSIMELQFHWMHRNRLDPRQTVKVDIESIWQMMQDIPIPQDTEFHPRRHFPGLESGEVFYTVIQKRDAQKMKAMLDIRWANTRLAALGGATGTWELPADHSEEIISDRPLGRVSEWLRGLPEMSSEFEPILDSISH